jgi:hypothetical protein
MRQARRIVLLAATSLPAIFGIGFAGTARATSTPFSGSFAGLATSINGSGGHFSDTFTETGSDTSFGSYTGSGSFDISFGSSTTITNGLFQWIYSGGVLSGTFSGSGGPSSVTITRRIASRRYGKRLWTGVL